MASINRESSDDMTMNKAELCNPFLNSIRVYLPKSPSAHFSADKTARRYCRRNSESPCRRRSSKSSGRLLNRRSNIRTSHGPEFVLYLKHVPTQTRLSEPVKIVLVAVAAALLIDVLSKYSVDSCLACGPFGVTDSQSKNRLIRKVASHHTVNLTLPSVRRQSEPLQLQ